MTTKKRTRRYAETGANKAKGFISAYQHAGPLEFVSHNNPDDPTNGYFRLPDTIEVERHMKNLIVTKASVFMAKRMRGGTSWGAGIGYLEVGTGVGSGTTQSPQAESAAQTALRTPLLRKAITSWTCLDTDGDPTASDTNVVQYTTTFTEAEAIGAIVEMGMFGGDATTTNGSGFMFNYKVFPVINKDDTMQLTIVWKVTY
jgi:hypothetical protein